MKISIAKRNNNYMYLTQYISCLKLHINIFGLSMRENIYASANVLLYACNPRRSLVIDVILLPSF